MHWLGLLLAPVGLAIIWPGRAGYWAGWALVKGRARLCDAGLATCPDCAAGEPWADWSGPLTEGDA